MAKDIKFIFVFLAVTFLCQAQTDTVNKYNAHGKKQGYWICYLDNKFKVTDSTKAVYAGFDLYDNGQNLTRIGRRRGSRHERVIDSINSDNKVGRFILLNGKVLFRNSRNILTGEEHYLHGNPIKFITYGAFSKKSSKCSNAITELVDFSTLYNNTRGTFYIELRDCSERGVTKYWFRKEEKKWKSYPIKE